MTHTKKLFLGHTGKRIYSSPASQAKNPWLAVNLSMFFPGLGQFYAGKLGRGFIWLIIELFLLIYSVWSIFSPDGQTLTGLIGFSLVIIVYLCNILDAHFCVYIQSRHQNPEKIPRKQKNPWFGVFASRVLPGLGQFYNQQSFLGLFFLSSALIFLQLAYKFSSLFLIPPTLTAIATYHAYLSFPYDRKNLHLSQRSLLAIMVGLIFAWGLISNQIPQWIHQRLELFVIPSESMQPTLQINDRIFVKKSQFYTPKRGDVVVFQPPEVMKTMEPESTGFFIKRIIASPGEKVKINQGIVYINDRPLSEDYIAEAANYELKEVTVPANHYFMLGDNRNNSFDSHLWGFLPEENIFGQAYKIYWPCDRVKSLIKT